ncbi:MAG: GNAT family N-acetyltransferase [Steroidobacteraceae bacterium]
MTAQFRSATAADAVEIAAIYNHYVRESVVTFEEEPVKDAEMASRVIDITASYPWLVAVSGGKIVGHACAAAWKRRSAYRFAAESTVYLAPASTGLGLGRKLYGILIAEMRSRGLRCAIAGISLPNPASIALHEKMGFRPVGRLGEVGWKFGRWVDVGCWELILS